MIFFYALAGSIVLLDQLTKFLAIQHLSGIHTVPVLNGVFHLTLVYNTGIAFGFFQEHPSLLLSLISVSLIVLLWIAHRMGRQNPLPSRLSILGLALIVGGAFGNWIDRLRIHSVIDFLDFRIWPVFNLADSFITVGVCLYLYLMMKRT